MTSQPIDQPEAADVGFTRRDLDFAARTAITRFLEQRDRFHLDERQARQAAVEWARDDLDDIAALNRHGDLPADEYGYNRLDVDQAAHDALGLFLELRDQHGYDEDHAQAAALSEVAEGTNQRDDEQQQQHGNPRKRDVASMQGVTLDVATLHHTPEEPGADQAPTWLAETNDRGNGRRGPSQLSDPATRRAELVVDAADDAACRAAMDAIGCDDDRWVDDPLGQQVYEDTLAERLREAGMTPEDHDRTVRERVARTERRQRIRGRYLDGLYGPHDQATKRDILAPPWVDVVVDRAMTVPSDPTDREIRTQIEDLERIERVVGTTVASRHDAEHRGDLQIPGEAWAVYDESERHAAEQAYRDGLAPATPRARVLVAQAETRERLEAANRIEAGEDPATVYRDYTFPRNDELGPVTDMEAHPEPRTYADTAREKLADLANYTDQVPGSDDTRRRLTWDAWEAMQQVPESERAQICRDTIGDDSLLGLTVDNPEIDRLFDAPSDGVDPWAGERSPFEHRERSDHRPERAYWGIVDGELTEVYRDADDREVPFMSENFAAAAAKQVGWSDVSTTPNGRDYERGGDAYLTVHKHQDGSYQWTATRNGRTESGTTHDLDGAFEAAEHAERQSAGDTAATARDTDTRETVTRGDHAANEHGYLFRGKNAEVATDEGNGEASLMLADRDGQQQPHAQDDLPAGAVLLHEVDEDPDTGEQVVSRGEPIEVIDHDDAVRAMNRIIAGEDPEQVLRETPHHPLIWGTDDEPAVPPAPVTPDQSEQARERANREAAAREQLEVSKYAAETRAAEHRDPDRDRQVDDRLPEPSHDIEREL